MTKGHRRNGMARTYTASVTVKPFTHHSSSGAALPPAWSSSVDTPAGHLTSHPGAHHSIRPGTLPLTALPVRGRDVRARACDPGGASIPGPRSPPGCGAVSSVAGSGGRAALARLRTSSGEPTCGRDARDAHPGCDVRDGTASADTLDEQPPAVNSGPGWWDTKTSVRCSLSECLRSLVEWFGDLDAGGYGVWWGGSKVLPRMWGTAAADEVGGSGVLFGCVQVTAVASLGTGPPAGGGDAAWGHCDVPGLRP